MILGLFCFHNGQHDSSRNPPLVQNCLIFMCNCSITPPQPQKQLAIVDETHVEHIVMKISNFLKLNMLVIHVAKACLREKNRIPPVSKKPKPLVLHNGVWQGVSGVLQQVPCPLLQAILNWFCLAVVYAPWGRCEAPSTTLSSIRSPIDYEFSQKGKSSSESIYRYHFNLIRKRLWILSRERIV